MNKTETILVTGASGNLGKLVLEALIKRGEKNLIGTTRNPEKLSELSQKGVDIRRADFKSPATLAEAFKGATRLLLISTTDVGARVEDHGNAIQAAQRAGVKHIIYTSWPNTETSVALVAPDHAATEKQIKECGLKYTFLRNYQYAENLLFSLPSALEMGTLYGCAGTGKAAYVTRQDCAEAGAGALINADRYENTTLDVSGPQAYSHAELVALVSELKGKKVVYQNLSPEEFKAASTKSGLPDAYAQLFASFDLSIKLGDLEKVTDTVQKLSGKTPQSLVEFLKKSLN